MPFNDPHPETQPDLTLPQARLLEGIVTTLNEGGSTNISPMGPVVDEGMTYLRLRPYQTSTTYKTLKRTGEGVLHVTDDVLLLAQAAVGQPDPLPRFLPAVAVKGNILADACRWYAFRVVSLDDSNLRTNIVAKIVDSGRQRDFFGFNRAKHAVIETAILATRVEFLPASEILAQLDQLAPLVEKTGGIQEQQAWELLNRFIHERFQATSNQGGEVEAK